MDLSELEEIIKGCKKEYLKSQQALYLAYSSQFLGECMRYTTTKEEAQEILLDAFLTIFDTIRKYNGKGYFLLWMQQTFVRAAIQKFKIEDFEFRSEDKSHLEHPDPYVWESIASKLRKRKRRKRYVILLYGLLVIPTVLSFVIEKENPKVDSNNETNTKSKEEKDANEKQIDEEDLKKYSDNNNTKVIKAKRNDINSLKNKESTDTISSPEKVATKKPKTVEPNPNAKQKEGIKSDPKKEEIKKKAPVKPKKSKPKKKRIKSKEKPKGIWSVSPYISIDTHHPFQIKTNAIATVNYGMYVNYTSGRFLLRLGYRTSNLKYLSQESNSFLRQELSYKEYPLELKYHFNQDHRIIPSIIGGVSFLSLSDAIEFEEQNRMIVENRNMTNFNRSNFTFNLGGGLQTKITNDLMINFESIFKYHFETYKSSRNSATFSITSQIGIQYSF